MVDTLPRRTAPEYSRPYTHVSQITVANSGTAVSCFSVSIHAPGRGSNRVHAGCSVSSTYGNASPIASAVNTANVTPAGCASANPIAAPISGAVHGVATTVASTPVKKLPV